MPRFIIYATDEFNKLVRCVEYSGRAIDGIQEAKRYLNTRGINYRDIWAVPAAIRSYQECA